MFKKLSIVVLLAGLTAAGSPQAATASSDLTPAKSGQTAGALRLPAYRDVTLAAGTILPLTLENAVASDRNRVEDRVRAHVRQPIVAGNVEVVPRGSRVEGFVSGARQSGKVKGLARLALRFNTLVIGDTRYDIATAVVARQAPSTKKEDAEKIALPAVGGAIVGAIVDGKKGAAIGGAVGGGGGTAYVLSTRGKEVRFGSGERLSVRLAKPLVVRVPTRASSFNP